MRNSMRLSAGDVGVPLGHRLLHLDRAAHRIDDAGKLDQQAVAGGLDDAAVVLGDLRIDELAPQRLEAFERAFLVRAHQPRIARDIGGEYRSETAGLAHVASPDERIFFSRSTNGGAASVTVVHRMSRLMSK